MKNAMCFAPIDKTTLSKTNFFRYIDWSTDEALLLAFDQWMVENRGVIHVWSIHYRDLQAQTFFTVVKQIEIGVDFWVYLTWMNTIHLRFGNLFNKLQVNYRYPHIHPNDMLGLVRLLELGEKGIEWDDVKQMTLGEDRHHPDYD